MVSSTRLLLAVSWVVTALLCGCTTNAPRGEFDDGPISLKSDEGVGMLSRAEGLKTFARLTAAYETQVTQTFCGVASSVIVLNSMGFSAPEVPEWKPYRAFTQVNFFDGSTEQVVPEEKIHQAGMTLAQLAGLLQAHGASVDIHYADTVDVATFRKQIRSLLAHDDATAIVNYFRPDVGQPGGGHISPVGAYDPSSDRFLILDVARYRLPPVWIKANRLWRAMNANDSESRRSRGYVVVRNGGPGS